MAEPQGGFRSAGCGNQRAARQGWLLGRRGPRQGTLVASRRSLGPAPACGEKWLPSRSQGLPWGVMSVPFSWCGGRGSRLCPLAGNETPLGSDAPPSAPPGREQGSRRSSWHGGLGGYLLLPRRCRASLHFCQMASEGQRRCRPRISGCSNPAVCVLGTRRALCARRWRAAQGHVCVLVPQGGDRRLHLPHRTGGALRARAGPLPSGQ